VLEDGSFATVLTINDPMCRWPIGDPAENEFHFCGRKPRPALPTAKHMPESLPTAAAAAGEEPHGRLSFQAANVSSSA